jgi:4-hydroxybenzoate polyprenyltransferase
VATALLPRRALALFRCSHPEPTVAVSAVAGALAVSAGRAPAGVLVTVAAVLAGQLSVGWSNDAVDARRDSHSGRRDKPLAAGLIGLGTVRVAAGLALAVCVPLSLLSGWRAAVVHLVAVLLAWGYNLGLKATRISVLPYAVAFALLPAFVTLGLPGTPAPPWWALLAGALLGSGAHFANALPDLDDDLRNGIRGLPHRVGQRAAARLAAVLLVSASATLVLGPGRLGAPGRPAPALFAVPALAAVAAVVLLGTLAGRTDGSRALFRASLVVALFDVVLLVVRGSVLV